MKTPILLKIAEKLYFYGQPSPKNEKLPLKNSSGETHLNSGCDRIRQ